ncbi:DoxX-like family protein [Chitinophaga terrae (ex Kim and Jung 2007)]|jgi:uncharacterized membrane protein YphA (DoxX/SURF4 family)|uniref:DoxX-like family protein n=1 Tax=Chitinophaga terrae (ex Kim and Jung 2007) TaxID=408074 RepID=A0A1H4FQ26_9BACT|nr:DoxX family membrane protein [Chitinophaga terrae (ex Kim and Jung 2007)]MDQ0109646.1 putative membrane protein YphA (DoxX/SURF4 family) [Chitinophaga terrae (ex Kim and Jung 2007)]GEP92658.1 hypothetical protein CTE07_43030 [Chitinophaga terrae (ex Kim and Jung 2007)]SEA99459.1 DoxX-like family protein [Chitinophaga terrae (ex Kim and Jung 2007)]
MKKNILFVLSLLFGLMFINAGLNKFLNYMPAPKDMPEPLIKLTTALGSISWFIPLVGIAELLGGILFIFRKTRALGALILFPVLVGILLINITAAPSGLAIVLPLWAIEIWVLIENRNKYLPMIS